MRLLHTRTLELSEFNDDQYTRPYYAILSHTWGEDEFVFSDFGKPHRRSSSGWRKLVKCCELAAADGWKYVWVDTCCIDKSSSAELTEAINSMWRWYEDSVICYVYLADCSVSNWKLDLPNSRWFTRGWTLQELLAPERVVFFDADWQDMGSRLYLQQEISQICRIAPDHLTTPTAASVATKMSWASRRQTTREEDLAYSLLGLFDINMPLIYGEGSKAFFRLQSEIIRSSTDQSIFAWASSDSVHVFADVFVETGMLAPHLSCFAESGDIVSKHFPGLPQTPYQMTNYGLQIEFGCEKASESISPSLNRRLGAPSEQSKFRSTVDHLEHKLRSSYAELWLIMLPCVRTIYEGQPIALLITRSHEGIFRRASARSILTFRKEMVPHRAKYRIEGMNFLIANDSIADRGSRLPLWFTYEPCVFIEAGPTLQQKVHDVQKLQSKQICCHGRVPSQGQHGKCLDPWKDQWVSEVDLKDGPRLVIMFSCWDQKWNLYASEGDHAQLSTYPVGAHIAGLGDTDDYIFTYGNTCQIFLSTRRRYTPKNQQHPSRGAVEFMLRLSLRTIC